MKGGFVRSERRSMNTTQPHDAQPDATAAHRPAAELVAGSAPASEDELVPLLRRRLRFLVLALTVFYVVFAILMRVFYVHARVPPIDNWANVIALVICFGFVALLSSRRPMTLRQLRVVEFLFFVVLVARMAIRGYVLLWDEDTIDRVLAWIAAGDVANAREMLTGLANRLILPTTLSLVGYGVIIPTTVRRCALVVGVFTLGTIGVWVAACITRGVPTGYWFVPECTVAIMVLILTAILSVYGAYRIESSRREAVEARRLGQY